MSSELMMLIKADLNRIKADAAALEARPLPAAVVPGTGHSAESFVERFKEAVYAVDHMDKVASEKMAAVDSGRSDDLVGAMLASQEASLSFAMLMQVRNKVVGAIDELIKMQL
ncbi:MAG: flagellar hook-basal body complex protein FliE [Gammaproteobacteria bacterium]